MTSLPGLAADQTDLPPAIAKLSSMRELAKPVTSAERRHRIERAQQLLAEHRMSSLLIPGGSSLAYFAGMRWTQSERMFALLIPTKGDVFCVCPTLQEIRVRELLSAGPLGNAEIHTWEDDEDPYRMVVAGLSDRGIRSGNAGIEETVPYVFVEGLAKAATGLTLVSGTPVTAGCRMIKSQHELELMRLAAKVVWAAFKAAHESIHEGMTNRQLSELVEQAYRQLGFEGFVDVHTNSASGLLYGSPLPQTIAEGTIVLMDGGCRVEDYIIDICRTFVVGKPNDKMKRVFEIVRQAHSAALKAAGPGIAYEQIDAAARKVISDFGFGPGYKYFSHRLGHGIGLDLREWPYVALGNKERIRPNIVFSDGPGIYLRGEFGVRIEDDIAITDSAAELMTPQSHSLEEPFKV